MAGLRGDWVLEVAYRQKLLLYAILFNLCVQAPIYPFLFIWRPLFWACQLLISALYIRRFYRLGKAIGWSLPALWMGSFCLFIPFVALVALLALNRKATTALQAAGVRIGLFGRGHRHGAVARQTPSGRARQGVNAISARRMSRIAGKRKAARSSSASSAPVISAPFGVDKKWGATRGRERFRFICGE